MENRYNKTRSVVEAGLLSALIAIIMLLNVYVPLFSVVGTFLLPIPITLLYIRYNYKVTLLAIIVSTILVGALYNPISAIVSAVSYGLIGIALGYCIRKDVKVSITLIYLTIASAISNVVRIMKVLIFIPNKGLMDLIKMNIDMFKESINMQKSMYAQAGMNTQQFDVFLKSLEIYTPEYVITSLFGLLLIAGFASALLNYVVTKTILKRMRYNIKDLIPFERWYIDNRIGALIISLTCLGIILSSRNYAMGKYILNSTLPVMQVTFLIIGMAVSVFYLKNRFNIKGILLAVIILFALITSANSIFLYLGIGDMIFDFRKLDPNRIFRRKNS